MNDRAPRMTTRRRVNAWALAVIAASSATIATVAIATSTSSHNPPGNPAADIAKCRADKQAATADLSHRVDPDNTMPIDQWNKLVTALPEPASCRALTEQERQDMANGTH